MYIEPHAPLIYCPWCRKSYWLTRDYGTVRSRRPKNDMHNSAGFWVAFCDAHLDAAWDVLKRRAKIDGDMAEIDAYYQRLYGWKAKRRRY